MCLVACAVFACMFGFECLGLNVCLNVCLFVCLFVRSFVCLYVCMYECLLLWGHL